MMQITASDRKVLSFFQDHMRTTGRAATLAAMRLRLGLQSEEHAKQAFTDLVEHLTQVELAKVA